MKKTSNIVKAILSIVVIAVLVFTFSPTYSSAAKKVKLSKTSITLKVGKTKTLKLKNNKKKVKWSSNKKKVATVTQKGKVTAKKRGTATITAKVGKKKYKCKVTVKAAANNNTPANNTPVVTVPTQSVKDNYSKLKSYILNYGSMNSSGNKFIKWNGSYNDSYGIVYNSGDASFDFIYVSSTTSANDALTMNIRESDLNKGFFKYVISLSSGLDATLTASGNINALNDSSALNWTIETNYSVTDETRTQLRDLGDSVFAVSFYGWNSLLNQSLGLTMADLGFMH